MRKMRRGIVMASCLLILCGMGATAHGELVGNWTFDDCGATDASGNGHDGTIHGIPVCVDRAGGKALEFDGGVGNVEYINVGTSSDYTMTTFSICAWVYPSPEDTEGVILAKADSYNFRVVNPSTETDGHLKLGIWGAYGQTTVSSGANTVPLNEWTCVCGTYNPQATEGYFKLYVNGQLIESDPYHYPTPRTNTNPVTIGWEDSDNSFYNGRLDEVRLYDHELSAAEVAAICDSGPEPCNCTDTDQDGVPDAWDQCADTAPHAVTDAVGCEKRSVVVIPMN